MVFKRPLYDLYQAELDPLSPVEPPTAERLAEWESNCSGPVWVPRVARRIMHALLSDGEALATQGIFRVSASASALASAREALDASGGGGPLPPAPQSVHVLAGLLKLFFRELPSPLVPPADFSSLVAAMRDDGGEGRVSLAAAVARIPARRRAILRALVAFLAQVAKYEEASSMGALNLATVFAPNILRPGDGDDNPLAALALVGDANSVLASLIQDFDAVFPPAESGIGARKKIRVKIRKRSRGSKNPKQSEEGGNEEEEDGGKGEVEEKVEEKVEGKRKLRLRVRARPRPRRRRSAQFNRPLPPTPQEVHHDATPNAAQEVHHDATPNAVQDADQGEHIQVPNKPLPPTPASKRKPLPPTPVGDVSDVSDVSDVGNVGDVGDDLGDDVDNDVDNEPANASDALPHTTAPSEPTEEESTASITSNYEYYSSEWSYSSLPPPSSIVPASPFSYTYSYSVTYSDVDDLFSSDDLPTSDLPTSSTAPAARSHASPTSLHSSDSDDSILSSSDH